MSMRQLTRDGTWSAQIGCGLAISIVLGGLGSFFVYMQKTHPQEKDEMVVYVVGYTFAAVGALMALSTVHQLLAVRSPETMVMIDAGDLVAGSSVRVRIVQPGPVRLYSLRANLVGEEIRFATRIDDSGVPHRTRTARSLGTYHFFEQKDVTVLSGEQWQGEATLVVPADALSTESNDHHTVTWRIEVWGRVRLWPDFMHPYVITVVGSQPAATSV